MNSKENKLLQERKYNQSTLCDSAMNIVIINLIDLIKNCITTQGAAGRGGNMFMGVGVTKL